MLLKQLFALALLMSLCCYSYAQQAKGTVYRKISNTRLAGVIVTNTTNHEIRVADETGGFTIRATAGDTLEFTKTDFTPQKQAYSGYDIVVYMQPELKLGVVRVVGQTKRQELSEVMKSYRSKGLYFDGKPPVTVFLPFGGSPITGFYELFGKDARNLRHFAKYAKGEIEATEVDRRYNKALVMRVTGLTDSAAVQHFMEFWRPSYEDLKVWADYDLMKHIRTNYDYYKKNGDKYKPLPTISAPASLGGPGPIKIKKP